MVAKKDDDLLFKDDMGNLGEGQTLTDLERNNKIMEKLVTVGRMFVVMFGALILILIWLIMYVIKNDVFNNTIRILGSC